MIKIKNRHFYIISFLILIIVIVVGSFPNSKKSFEGKLIFDSAREKDGIYICANGKPKFFVDKANFPRWNFNGNKISAIKGDVLFVFNIKNKKVEQKIFVKDAQIIATEFARDDKSIFYVYRVRNNESIWQYFFCHYFFDTKRNEIMFEINNQKIDFLISSIFISQDNKTLAFYAGDKLNNGLFILDINTNIYKLFWKDAYPLGWDLQNNLVFFSTKNINGSEVDSSFGVILKINLQNNKFFWNIPVSFANLNNIKMTRNAEKLYFSRLTENQGVETISVEIKNGKLTEEKVLLGGKFIDNNKGYSRDLEPDWFI